MTEQELNHLLHELESEKNSHVESLSMYRRARDRAAQYAQTIEALNKALALKTEECEAYKAVAEELTERINRYQ